LRSCVSQLRASCHLTLRHDQYQEVASDGRSASVYVIPTLEVAEAVWCVILHPSRLWSPVGTATTAVDGPQVTSGYFVAVNVLAPVSNLLRLPSWQLPMRWWIYLTRVYAATTSFQGSANAFELLSFKLFGRGLVRGATRLAFKASAVACGGSSPTSDLTGGDAVGLSSANVVGEIYVCVTGVFGFVP